MKTVFNPLESRIPGAPWSCRDAAKFLGISQRHLHRMMDLGEIKEIRIGKRRLVPDTEVRKVATEGCSPSA